MGKWYKGAHKPLITKELFDLVQNNIADNLLQKRDTQKEFAFTKIMTCGLCGSGITADEKFKTLKDGIVNRHVYYKCTKVRNHNCELGFINEKDLIIRLQNLIDNIDLNKLALKEKISKEVYRFKRFQTKLLQNQTQITIKEIDIREYVKFILEEGEMEEKREVLNCVRGKILISEKGINIQ